MAIDLIPRGYQELIATFIVENRRCAVWSSPGTGKTGATLIALEALSFVEDDVYPALVVAPLRVARTGWPNETRKWNQLKHLRVVVVTGTLKERRAALRIPADIYTTNFEQLPWLVEELGDRWPFKTVVADEATKLKGFRLRQGTQRAKALARVAHTKIKRMILLTGTPSPNGLQDLWGQMWFVDKGDRLGRTFDAFKQRWFRASHTGFGVEATDQAQGEIQAALKDVCITIDAADWFALEEPIINKIMVELPAAAKVMYKQMEKQFFMELGSGQQIEALNAAAKSMKCIAEGTEILTNSGWKPIEQFAEGDLVWDGVEWVSVCKLACHGYKSVVECFGVTMTADHKVLTKSGWHTAEDVNHANASGRFDRESVRLPDDTAARRIDQNGEVQEGALGSTVRMREDDLVHRGKPAQREPGRKEILRVPKRGDVDRGKRYARNDRRSGVCNVDGHDLKMPESERQGLGELRRAGNYCLRKVARVVQVFLGRHGTDPQTGVDDRTHRQQRQLREGKLPLGYGPGAVEQYAGERMARYSGRPSDGSTSGQGVRGQVGNAAGATEERMAGSESYRLVYDLVNAGPRHRFTVRGKDGKPLIVHNCLQLANGAVYLEGGQDWEKIHDEKLDALEEIIEEAAGMPVLTAYHFKSDLARLKKRFPDGIDLSAKGGLERAQAGEGRVWFGHPASMGHGVDGLQYHTNIMAFFGYSWSLENYLQFIERIGPTRQLQAGFKRPVFMHMIMAADTVDELVLERLHSKREVQDILMEAMKERGFKTIEEDAA